MSHAASTGSRTDAAAGGLISAVRELLSPVASTAGFDLEDVEVIPAGRRRVLRLVVDRDGGLDLDAVAIASRAFAEALDDAPVMGGAPYTLEVTSPGVDRPLTEPRHWRRAAGRLVRARRRAGGEVRGRVVAADDDAVTIATPSGEQRFGYDQLGRGRVEVEFNRTAEEGRT